ncbi:MAG: rod shape-determining protein MreC [Clostridiales bacterium]|nr:rod shape-determining protein MreC [Clostridiales bacterium]
MARREQREFSESESLRAQGGQDDFGVEERKPLWALEMESSAGKQEDDLTQEAVREADAGKRENADSQAESASREEKPAPEPPRQGRDSAGESRTDERAADEAWSREAKRVESAAQRRRERPAEPAGNKNRKGKKKKNGRGDSQEGFLRNLIIIVVCSVLFIMVAMTVVSNFVDMPILQLPKKAVTAAFTPVQRLFSGVTDRVVEYLRTLKIRGNLEYEYDQLLIKLDEMATEVAVNEELRRTNQSLYDLLDEQERNRSMNPLAATVIGTDTSNYFSTLTLDVGSKNGVTEYMAVVAQGGLVGVTYDVKDYKCQVRCIINSDCTVAGLVQSSRDQGSVKGTLGTDGKPMCRMYYLPDSSLPRPGDVVVTSGVGLEFPKGIPIGYIRESTRGMDDNKSYVVLEPVVDFQHLEYVTVYRYRPTYAEAAQARVNASQEIVLEPLATARPIPEWETGGVSDFIFSATDAPSSTGTPEDAATSAPQDAPTPTPAPSAAPAGTEPPPNLEYRPADKEYVTPTPTARPTFTPEPSPVPTPDPGAMKLEDDE